MAADSEKTMHYLFCHTDKSDRQVFLSNFLPIKPEREPQGCEAATGTTSSRWSFRANVSDILIE
jgi:hypothetical protein